MLDFMKVSQIAALSLGIIFAVISIATTLLAIKYAKQLNSFAKAAALSLLAPFIACTSWMYLILSFIDGLRKNEILALVIALILSIFIFGMIVIVAKALYSKHGADFEAVDEMNENNELDQEELTENNESLTAAPLFLENVEEDVVEIENDEEVEENQAEDIVALAETEEVEEQEEIEENETENEEVVEETVEETAISDELVEEVEENDENETTDEIIEEVEAKEETENEEVVEETVEENESDEIEEEISEEVAEEIKDTDETKENFDDEFDKFIEELKKKVDSDNNDDNK